jgi:surface-anchored protein
MLDGQLHIQVKDSTTVGKAGGKVVWREPSQVVLHAKQGASVVVPAAADLSFLGKPGDRIFLLPQVQQPGLLWLGWDSEELDRTQFSENLTWKLNKVDGPGRFALFLSGTFGEPTKIFVSTGPLPETTELPPGTHTHANWAFSAPGVYHLTFEVNGTTPAGQVVSDTEIYTFVIGDGVDPRTVALPSSSPNLLVPGVIVAIVVAVVVLVLILILRRRRA